MIVDLPDTTTSKISKKIMALREQGGVIALGRVLTLVVVTKSGLEEEAIEAANEASREHPCRIIVARRRRRRGARPAWTPRSGSAGTPARPRSSCCAATANSPQESESLVAALLLPDAPIVAWWPHGAPKNACETSIGRIAHRRITDSANEPDPQAALDNIRAHLQGRRHGPGLDPADQLAHPARRGPGPGRRLAPSRPSPSRAPPTPPAPSCSRPGSRWPWTPPSPSSRTPPAPASGACG